MPADAPLTIAPGQYAPVPTGIAIALPPGTEAQVRPRSGLARNHGITVLNSPGTVDADYRGEIQVLLINHGAEPFTVTRGMRIAQLVVAHVITIEFARGDGTGWNRTWNWWFWFNRSGRTRLAKAIEHRLVSQYPFR